MNYKEVNPLTCSHLWQMMKNITKWSCALVCSWITFIGHRYFYKCSSLLPKITQRNLRSVPAAGQSYLNPEINIFLFLHFKMGNTVIRVCRNVWNHVKCDEFLLESGSPWNKHEKIALPPRLGWAFSSSNCLNFGEAETK